MISILVILGLMMVVTLPMALGYVGLIGLIMAGVFFSAIYAINYGLQWLSQSHIEEYPWWQKNDKAG